MLAELHRDVIIAMLATSLLIGCMDCEQKVIGKKEGQALTWESIPLGIDEAKFKQSAVALAGMSPKADLVRVTCGDQAHFDVPDVGDRVIIERSAGTHVLTNCILKPASHEKSTNLIELRGEFIDHRLARLTYRFSAATYDQISAQLGTRFGPGLKATFKEQSIVEEAAEEYHIWRFTDLLWTFSRGEAGTARLVQQDLAASRTLPEPPPPAKRGKPVSLDDLGIGKLDLDAPQPEIDIPDAG